ncbi:zinc-dependent metalloprotease family protein [Aeromicrobium sp.]|uniref:zinc-dependent metalloprotease family protein n=2 Tax=Aeromicrobium sp. TaxID=1871063 RepID=UPI0040344434
MRRVAMSVGALLVTAVLVAVPRSVSAQEPTISSSGDEVVYTDPALEGEPTATVEGVLREVVVERAESDGHGEGGHVGAEVGEPVLVTDDGSVVPVDLEALAGGEEALEELDLAGAPVVAELVESASLESALDGTVTQAVDVATAVFDRSETTATTGAHRAYVAIVANSGSVDATSTIESRIAAGLTWWSQETGATFSRAGTVRYSSARTDRCGFDDVSGLWSEAMQRFPTVDFSAEGNHLVVVVDDQCDGTGVGTIGGSVADGGLVTLTESSRVFTPTLVHEVGHNLGLRHANLESVEYWDLYSPMGLAVSGSGTTALDTEYRAQLGLAGSGEVEVVPSGTAVTRTLAARGSTSGLRGLEVRSGGTSHWVEWRPATGRDASSYYAREATGSVWVSGTRKYPTGVTVSTRATDGTGVTSLRPRLDGTVRQGAWRAGQSYVSGSVTVRVDAISSTAATVTVANGVTAPPATVVSATPLVSGVAKVGSRLTGRTGTWTPGVTFAYQWRLDGATVAGATASTFVPAASHRGKRVSVRVTGSLLGLLPISRTSASTAAVVPGTLTHSTPRISGTVKVGRRLSALRGTWTSGTTFSYRWYANGKAIYRATRSTYVPTRGVKGKRLTVKVTGRKSGYTTVTRTSARTTTVK